MRRRGPRRSSDESGRDLFAVTALTDFQIGANEGGHAGRYSHPRSPNAERSTPGGAYHPAEPIAGAELQSDLLVAIRNPQRRTRNRIWLRGSQWSRRGV